MTKFIILLAVLAAAVSSIHGTQADDNDSKFPNFGLYKPFNFGSGFPQQAFSPWALLNPDYIKNLKPGPGQTVSGMSASSSSSSETVNGVTKRKHSGHVVTNEDGKVNEFSF